MSWLDDHARYVLRVTCRDRVIGPIVRDAFRAAPAVLDKDGIREDQVFLARR